MFLKTPVVAALVPAGAAEVTGARPRRTEAGVMWAGGAHHRTPAELGSDRTFRLMRRLAAVGLAFGSAAPAPALAGAAAGELAAGEAAAGEVAAWEAPAGEVATHAWEAPAAKEPPASSATSSSPPICVGVGVGRNSHQEAAQNRYFESLERTWKFSFVA